VPDVHLWPERKRLPDGALELAATVEASGCEPARLWYRVPADWEASISDTADTFIVGALFLLMRLGRDVRVHGDVSPSLLSGVDEFQAAWSIWRPWKYRKVEISADREVETGSEGTREQAISGFSGGVDSSFTAYRHVRGVGLRRSMPLRAGVMVHGFDIPLNEPEVFKRAQAKAARQIGNLGLALIPVTTNYRTLDVEWTDAFGSAVASVLMLFQKTFGTGLIAQGVPYHCYHHIVEGSNPLTDPLLSSDSFRVIPDGAAFQRMDKIEVLSGWAEGLESLRVCWQGQEKDRNCCRCEKCIRNILTFRALGLGLPPCFEHDVSDEQIRGLRSLKEIIISVGYEPIVRLAERAGQGKQSWIRAIRAAIRVSRRNRILRRADPRPVAAAVVRRLGRLAGRSSA
jgi:hypothetical protein